MSADAPVVGESDTRDFLMHVADLRAYFYQRTAQETFLAVNQPGYSPSLFGILISIIATVVLVVIDQIALFGVVLALSCAQIAWLFWTRSRSKEEGGAPENIFEQIKSGNLPRASYDSVMKRLRWWDHLIVPQDWTANSRIFDVRKRIQLRIDDIEKELAQWESPSGKEELAQFEREMQEAQFRREDQRKKLRALQSHGAQGVVMDDEMQERDLVTCDDPQVLTARVTNSQQCDVEIKRIMQFENPQARARQEKVLHQAMLIKINKVGELLDSAAALCPQLEKITAKNLSEAAAEALTVLENRRAVVTNLNRINHSTVSRLLAYNIAFVQTSIALKAKGY